MASGVFYRSSSSIFLSVFLLLAFFFCSSSSLNIDKYGMVGGKKEVKDVKNKAEIQDLGRFSVEEYNKNQYRYQQDQGWFSGNGGRGRDLSLKFKEVVKAQTQIVSGFKYFLTISVSQDRVSKTYDAIVIMKPWVHSKQLITFAPSSMN
ncbi:hypothetical protein NE237_005542 [Protea cynaroides]|uniref:Cystatin domain-containing protein n=1 Tax=Protea cynaroides TaxID=273540 RepID=A0A9Q0GNI8_9MAGN|nr:hypothetical protein NE237_005542 [Protea cynaroides]